MVGRLFLLSVVAVVVVMVATTDNLELAESDELIEAINKAQTTWTAGRNFPVGTKKEKVKRLLGLKKSVGESILPMKEDEEGDDLINIPDMFDAREHWPKCHTIKEIKDQSDCGSCWAVAAAACLGDRICIASSGRVSECRAAHELMSCCTECGDGCRGGWPDKAWHYFKTHGLVTGGDYGSNEGCQPYPMKPCEHFVNGSRTPCPDMHNPPTPKCFSKCTNSKYQTPFKKDHWKTKKSYRVPASVPKIQREILQNGPVEAGFTVYADFLSYKSGVYQHISGAAIGGHAVRVIGWGVEKGTPYWLVTNSWNTDWGDNGLFKIRRGNDECSFECQMIAGEVAVQRIDTGH